MLPPKDRQAQEECSFLKNRTKKLLLLAASNALNQPAPVLLATGKSFLLLFSKKKSLLSPSRVAASVGFYPLDVRPQSDIVIE